MQLDAAPASPYSHLDANHKSSPAVDDGNTGTIDPSMPLDDNRIDPIDITLPDIAPALLPEIVNDNLLEKYDLRIEPGLRVVFCLKCSTTVLLADARGHVTWHFASVPASSHFETIFTCHGIDGEVRVPNGLIPPIPRLKHIQGFKCGIPECRFLSASKHSMQRHFSEMHAEPADDSKIENASMHQIYEFRGHTTLVEMDANLTLAVPGSAFESYLAVNKAQRKTQTFIYHCPKDTRQLSRFLHISEWH